MDNDEFWIRSHEDRMNHISCMMWQENWCEREDANGVVPYAAICGTEAI
jgi:hypothetical protein